LVARGSPEDSKVKTATILSACECQARLGAELDERRHVVGGWGEDIRRRERRPSPAHSIHPERDRFDVGWLCAFCHRNTLRSFDATALAYRERASSERSSPSVPSA
jgi:hypothetical protein